jgi:hypothetical protein
MLEALLSSFDLSALKTATRLRIVADRDEGIFALEVTRPSGIARLPVRGGEWDAKKGEWLLMAAEGESPARVYLRLTADQHHPLEIRIEGAQDDLNQVHVPVSLLTSRGIELFASAEDELALQSLAGDWDNNRGERISITSVSPGSAIVDFGRQRVSLDIARAPQGSDVLLLPRDGSSPKIALALRGPNVFARFPITCADAGPAGPGGCRVSGTAQTYRRVGSQLNAR